LPDLTTVAIVLDPEYGGRVAAIQSEMRVWIVRSRTNEATYDGRRSVDPNSAIFKVHNEDAREDNLIGVLQDIENHFGSDATAEPYRRIRVIGLPLNASIAARLSAVGFAGFTSTADGFMASVTE
jgi:hypothetical protein